MSATAVAQTAGGPRDRTQGFRVAFDRLVFGLVPLVLLGVLLATVLRHSGGGFDYHYAYWGAGERVLHGQDPYTWTQAQIRYGLAFVYPAFSAVVFAPLSLLGRNAGTVVVSCLCVALAPATLLILRVRDWRLYGVTLMWLPVVIGWVTANETLFLVFGTACVWRYRDRPKLTGFLIAVLISLKPMMWPLGIWLLATRRWNSAAYALIIGLALNAIAWSIVGFAAIGSFLHVMSADTDASWHIGFGFSAMASHLGLGRSIGDVVTVIVALGLAAATAYAGYRRRDARLALTYAIALAVASSPLVWNHYFSLLLIPMALYRPRLGWLWLLPLLLWVEPSNRDMQGWQVVVAWAVVGTMFAVTLRRSGDGAIQPDGASSSSLIAPGSPQISLASAS